jgi:hypothetical protein
MSQGPPLANDRLQQRPDGRLRLRLKTRWRDGSTQILMERSELIERLVPLIPAPRAHQVRYHGILAPGASQRDWVVPGKGPGAEGTTHDRADPIRASAEEPGARNAAEGSDHLAASKNNGALPRTPTQAKSPPREKEPLCDPTPLATSQRKRWAQLLQRVFDVAGQLRWPSACESKIHRDGLRCPRCGSTLRLIAAIEDPAVARKILECLRLPARAPPLEPAALDALDDGGPQAEEAACEFDQTPTYEEP